MQIQIKLFASLVAYQPDQTAGVPFTHQIKDGVRVADVLAQLQIPEERVKMIFVNNRHAGLGQALGENDVLALFPPVAGG